MLKNKRVYLIIITFCILSFNCFCAVRGGQDLIPAGHWVYDSFRKLQLEQKNIAFTDFAPISIQEFKYYFNEIDYDKLSDSGKKEYDRIVEYLGEKNWSLDAGAFSIGIEPSLNPEFYFTSDCTKDKNDCIPWVYDYTKRKALLDIPIKAAINDSITLYMGLQAKQSRYALEKPSTFFNDVFSQENFDLALTHDTYLSAGYTWGNGVGINMRLAIMPQSYGQSLMPSAVLSEYLTDTTNFDFRIYAPFFTYDFNVTQFTRESYLYTHRAEVRLFGVAELSLIEGVFAYNTFDMRLMNPFAIFHGLGLFEMYEKELRINSLFAFKANFIPMENMRIYALYVQNEHQMQCELDKNPGADKVPEGFGIQTGVEYNVPLKTGYLHFGTEAYYAAPFLFIKDNPMLSFARVYSESLNNLDAKYYEWMGNPLGPDSIGLAFTAGYEEPGKWGVALNYNFAAKGENAGDYALRKSDWNYYTNKAEGSWVYDENADMRSVVGLSGVIEYNNIITVCAFWNPTRWLSFTVQPSYIFVNNYNHQDGYNRQGFQIALSSRIFLTKLYSNDLNSIDLLQRKNNK